MNINQFKAPVGRVILSSAFSNRMLNNEALCHKIDITVEDAKALINIAEMSSNVEFLNALNPRHESTCVLAKGLTDSAPTGAMVSLNVGDLVIVMQPSAASRNDTEFNVGHFEACIFQAIQRLPLS